MGQRPSEEDQVAEAQADKEICKAVEWLRASGSAKSIIYAALFWKGRPNGHNLLVSIGYIDTIP